MTPAEEAKASDYIQSIISDFTHRNWPGVCFHCLELVGHVLKTLLKISSTQEEMSK